MSIRTILVPVRGDGKGEGVLDHAVALATPFSAHIDVIHCQSPAAELLPYSTVITAAMRQTILDAAVTASHDEAERLQRLFADYLASRKIDLLDQPPAPAGRVSAAWRIVEGHQASVVAVRGRLADVIAVAQPAAGGPGANTLEAALLETGRLVLMCPAAAPQSVGRHVAIGWNGSAESARAVAAGLPILATAETITVFAAPEGAHDELTVGDLVRHLGWHGISVDSRTIDVPGNKVGQALLAESKAVGADVLLIGGYGHSRRRELVMGGVTRYIIEHGDLPVLMVH